MSTEKVKADRHTLRAARARLELTQEALGSAAGVSALAVRQLETGKVASHESTREAIQSALEARGIVFTNGDKPGFYFDKTKADIPT